MRFTHFTHLALALVCSMPAEPAAAAGSPVSGPTAVLQAAMREAKDGLARGEHQIAESRYRTALLEGWLLKGTLELEEGRLAEARAAFEHAAASAVETRRPWMSLALVELRLGAPREAVVLLRAVLAQNRADFAARRLLARALMAAGQVAEAVQELEELRVLAPENLENAFLLATAYLRQGRPEAAEPLFAELAEKRPMPETHVLIGRTYRDYDHWERARRALETALAMDPRVRRAHYYLGTVAVFAQGLGLLDEAMEHFEAELAIAPEDPLANLYLGIALVEKRRHEEALPRLEIASRLLTRPDAYQFLGRSYLALGRPAEAVSALRQGLELAEAEPEREADERGPADFRERQLASLHYQLAQALRRTGDEEAAAVHFAAAKRSSARAAEGSRDLLDRYLRNEAGEKKLDAFTSPLESSALSKLDPARRRELAGALKKSLAQAYLNLGVLQLRSEHHARAAELFAEAAELAPDFPQLQYSLGVAHFNSGRFDRATAPLARALAEKGADAGLRRMLALAWFNSGGYDEAAALLRDDPERHANPALEYAYAVALVRSGRAAEAQPIFARLLTANAEWPELNVVLGQAHAQQDDYDAAIRYLEKAIELKPDVAEAHATLGDIYLRQGKLAAAEEALRTELRSHPNDARARYTLAVVLDLHRKPEEALEMLRPLLAEQPDFADARYLLGKILLAQGALAEARAQLEAAAGLAPDDPNIRYQLGQAYQRLGRPEEARREFESYRRLKREGGQGP